MPYEATVINVMLAGPSDVCGELEAARDIVYEWNFAETEESRIVALPIGWNTHAAPQMGDRPQAIINRQVLDRADVLVAIIAARHGTPTGEYASGTEEEIRKSTQDGRWTMVYFSNVPRPLNQIDGAQLQKVREFREWLDKNGLYGEFSTVEEFRTRFSSDLRKAIQEIRRSLPVFPGASAERGAPASEDQLSEKATELLIEAAQRPDSPVLCAELMDGIDISINGKSMCERRDHRSLAEWREALQQLKNNRLLRDRGTAGEVFEVTAEGYRVVGTLQLRKGKGEQRRQQSPREKGLAVLLKNYDIALEEEKPSWEFAVEATELRDLGLYPSDFRLLMHKGYVEHAEAFTRSGIAGRGFQLRPDPTFTASSCFVLTAKGSEYARKVLESGEKE